MFMFNALLAAGLALQTVPAATAAAPVPMDPPPPPDRVMAIPDELREAFRTQVLDVAKAPESRLRRMVEFMLGEDGLGLQYEGDTTRTVAESYRTREVNCLSFTLMAVALAREAGLEAHGQQIDRVLAWNLIGDVVMQSLHANAVVTIHDRDFMVDIASNSFFSAVTDYKVEDEAMLASFYGNRAMELLADGRLPESREWLDMAMTLSPEDPKLWNNAGVLSQRIGDMAAAEGWFLRAAKQDPRLMSVLYNLVALYDARGDATRAAFWQGRADKILREDPFYQFSLGERTAQSGNYEGAIPYYRRAIALDDDEELFHFVLARAYVQLDKLGKAESELKAAYRLSAGSDRPRFQAKLDALQQMGR